jgi:spore coat protein U-like protein
MKHSVFAALLALLLSGALHRAAAQQVTCTVSATPVSFGLYVTVVASPDDSTGTVSMSCTTPGPGNSPVGVSYSIALSGGGGNTAARRMLSGGSQLGYQLYQDAARSIPWGDTVAQGVGGSGQVRRDVPLTASHTIHGRIPARQAVASGSYADVIQVIVTY